MSTSYSITDYSDVPPIAVDRLSDLRNKEDFIWRTDKPPVPGWWNATVTNDANAYRYWDCENWSYPVFGDISRIPLDLLLQYKNTKAVSKGMKWCRFDPYGNRNVAIHTNNKSIVSSAFR